MNDIEDVIAQYKQELIDEAEIARDDLQEIEDHLRTLTTELRERGMSSAEAVRAACVQLGNPRAVAREHAKVHSPFGARLSWPRTASAALLLLIGAVSACVSLWQDWDMIGMPFVPVGMVTFFVGLTVALLARLTWARAVLLGTHVYFMTLWLLLLVARPDGFNSPVPVLMMLGLAVIPFLMPWRRRELYSAGYALCLLAFAFVGTVCVPPYITYVGLFGAVPALLAIAGAIVRAKWAAWAAAFTAVILFVSTIEVLYHFIFKYDELEYAREWLPQMSMLLASMAAAVIGAVMSWRSARSGAGSPRYALS